MTTRTVRLELLRSGPAHNQLLSPLTPYIAVCGNRPAETVYLHSEHLDVVERLDRLRYHDNPGATEYELRSAGEAVVRLLTSIRGLQEEVSLAREHGVDRIHLRLILSAQELAILPFELAQAPIAAGGHGRYGFAVPPPVVLTRESRRESRRVTSWPVRPRVLVVLADPLGRGLPRDAHLLALRRALAPWLDRRGVPASEALRQRIEAERDGLVEVIERASLEAVARRCEAEAFTHVHVLCHGVPSPGREPRFGLALHDAVDPRKSVWVDGERLASAVLAGGAAGRGGPSVLSLMVCDAANVATVLRPNASLAHALHEAGIPLVVASQLPLTFTGSAVMTDALYCGLLAGDDPLAVLARARAELLRTLPTTHDWAAMTTYSSLPDDLDALVRDARVELRKFQVEGPLNEFDRFGLDENSPDSAQALRDAAVELLNSEEYRRLVTETISLARAKGPLSLMRYISTCKRLTTLGLTAGDSSQRSRDAHHSERFKVLAQAHELAREVFAATRSGRSLTHMCLLEVGVALLEGRVPDGTTKATWKARWAVARGLVTEERQLVASGQRLPTMDGRDLSVTQCDALFVMLWALEPIFDQDVGVTSCAALDHVVRHVRSEPTARGGDGYLLLRELLRYQGHWLAFVAETEWPGTDLSRQRLSGALAALVGAGVETRYRPVRGSALTSPASAHRGS